MGRQVSHPEWRDELLEQLDAAAELDEFPGQPNEYFALADMRMTAFRSDDEWLLVFEVVGWGIRRFAFENKVMSFGNRLDSPGFRAVEVVRGPGGTSPWGEDDTFELDADDLQVEIRGEPRALKPSYAGSRPLGDDQPMPAPARAIRRLAAQFPGDLFLSDDELLEIAGRSGSGLTRFLQMEDWRQPDIYELEQPSEMPCFQSLAAALAEADASSYDCPESEWNTHWSRWED